MAEAVFSDLTVGLVSKASSLLLNEIVLLWGVKDELEKLKRTVSTIESVLLHAEELSMEKPEVKNWLGMLGEAMYDVDDLLDEFYTEASRQQGMSASSSNQVAFGFQMAHKFKTLRERLDEIAAKRAFHLEERSYVERSRLSNGSNRLHFSPPQVVIGREQEMEAIIDLLLGPDYEDNVSVVSIVGIGGMGKTTLAQMVYNNYRVQNHFELKMWVRVSDNFNVQLLVKNVLESASGKAYQTTRIDILDSLLHEHINARRYLLVLDDVWNEDDEKWLCFKDLLACGARGSKIVITTRLRKVADMSRPIFIHDIRGLSENDAWSLFKKMTFKEGRQPSSSLEAMGKEIVAKCCGVPLAIKIIGGMLFCKDSEFEWELFKEKELLKIDLCKNDILPILKLSYHHLPSHYKHCFAYCSLYPKDFKIPVEELIQLWKAQGHLKSTNSNESLSDVGFGYFMDLYQLSFFQEIEMDDYGNINYCKMHDLLHDLAKLVAGENVFASHFGSMSVTEKTQHMSFRVCHDSTEQNFASTLKAKRLRTILSLYPFGEQALEVDAIICNMRCLRVLDLSCMVISTLPNSISELKHLRYLDLSNGKMEKLPDSITDLYNLQAVKLIWCSCLIQLPNNITKLVNLTDLDNSNCKNLSHMPQGIGKITLLEKLSEYAIAKDRSLSKHIGGLDDLHLLNNLRGELKIMNLRYVKNAAFEFSEAHLSLKQKLQILTLDWGNDEDENNSAIDVSIEEMGIEALYPHHNLKELRVSFYRGGKPPSWLPSITNLVSVSFENCRNVQWLPPLDQLPCLKRIWLRGSTKLEHIYVENGERSSPFFPSLTDLTLFGCPELKGFERLSPISNEELPYFPRLSLLEIRDCSTLAYLPLFSELKQLITDGNGIKLLMKILKMPTPFYTFSQLEHLSISNMKDSLEDEFLMFLPSLQSLSFRRCSFKSVCGDEKDDGIQWQSLKVLRSIEFKSTKNMVALPKGLQYATGLQHLHIFQCPKLVCMPEWTAKLSGLQHLSITFSPKLEERCKNSSTKDWRYISHIPNIQIGGEHIQRNGCYLL